MTSAQKRKGDEFERDQRDHAITSGVPCARTKAGYERDGGDLHFYPRSGRLPFIAAQCKATPNGIDLAGFLRSAEEQRAEAGALLGVAVVKRRNVADAGQQYVAMTYDTFLALTKLAARGVGLIALEPEES